MADENIIVSSDNLARFKQNNDATYAPISHSHSSQDVTLMTGYTKASQAAAIAATDPLNVAIGKLEKALDGKGTSNLVIGNTSTTAAAGNHTHTLSIATSTGTSALTLAHGGKYVLTAGGSTFIFTMPAGNLVGTSDEIPATANTGDVFYNTTDDIPLWFDGSVWRDSHGNIGGLKLVLATEAQIRAIFTDDSVGGGGADPVFTSTHDGGNASTSNFDSVINGGNASGI